MKTLDFSKYKFIITGTIGFSLVFGVLYALSTPSNDRQWPLDQEKIPIVQNPNWKDKLDGDSI